MAKAQPPPVGLVKFGRHGHRAHAAEPGQAFGPDRFTAAWDNLQHSAGDRRANARLLAVLQSDPSPASPSLNAP
jgi:hypothetical protein